MPPYLTRIEGPPPKRNVVSSSLAGGAKNNAESPVFEGFLLFYFCFSYAAFIESAAIRFTKHLHWAAHHQA